MDGGEKTTYCRLKYDMGQHSEVEQIGQSRVNMLAYLKNN